MKKVSTVLYRINAFLHFAIIGTVCRSHFAEVVPDYGDGMVFLGQCGCHFTVENPDLELCMVWSFRDFCGQCRSYCSGGP
jgi:hypothetical protein